MTNFNQKTVAVSLLLFISVIAPTLTFGAVYGKVTGNQIGAVEAILGTAWVNVAYALIGGMPLVRGPAIFQLVVQTYGYDLPRKCFLSLTDHEYRFAVKFSTLAAVRHRINWTRSCPFNFFVPNVREYWCSLLDPICLV